MYKNINNKYISITIIIDDDDGVTIIILRKWQKKVLHLGLTIKKQEKEEKKCFPSFFWE